MAAADPLFQWKAKASLPKILPMGMQHVVAAVVSTVGPALMVSKNCGLDDATTTLLVQMALLMTAFSTILMLFPVTKYIGSGLPVIMGVGFYHPHADEQDLYPAGDPGGPDHCGRGGDSLWTVHQAHPEALPASGDGYRYSWRWA